MADRSEHYDAVVVGAGIAGLNAVAVASEYVGPEGRVLLVDRRLAAGGMWNDTYDYVRLHQPHAFFTAGGIPWTQGHPREHLATKPEVLRHMRHCLDTIAGRTQLDTRFGSEYVAHVERDGLVEVTLRSDDGASVIATTRRLVKAFGYDVATNPPFAVSSDRVRSISPDDQDVRTGAISADSAPVWIIGGGKTGMDTALALVGAQPGRDVRMLVGGGTAFSVREKLFPTGVHRWIGGSRPNQYFIDLSLRFDGANETQAMAWFLSGGGHSPVARPRDYMLGILGHAEAATIRAGVTEFVSDHLVDVQDVETGPQLVLRSGATRPIEDGSWLVNCTGYLARHHRPYEPFSSATGRVLTITDRSATTHLTSFAGYLLTHALMKGLLPLPDLYEVDLVELREKAKPAWGVTAATLTLYNIGVLFDALPSSIFLRNQLDFDRWYPKPRTFAGGVRFMATHRRTVAKQRRSLDVLRERGIRCGPLAPPA
jgi:pyridine nucleotide-disulfide oxidoreductase